MSDRRSLNTILCLLLLVVATAALSGCGPQMVITAGSGTVHMQGRVHGGQQGVSGATVQLYAAGTGGNGSAASPLIPTVANGYYLGGAPGCLASSTQTCYSNVLSDANGNFTLTGDYTCPTSNAQVYLVATGGNPGLAAPTNNSALAMMTALGNCNALFTNQPYVTINEVTTVAAAWALAPFMTAYDHVGSSATNTAGMTNAMLNAQLLASSATGSAATLPSGETIEANKLYALADALAPCVNSPGSGCGTLFSAATPAGGTAPSNTLSAALNIVRNPGQNVTAVYQAISGTPPFATGYTQAPNDWTMSLTVTSPNMLEPTAIDVDASGNVWMVGREGVLDEYSPQGTVLSDVNWYLDTHTCTINGQTEICQDSYLQQSLGLTIDTNGYIWVTDYSAVDDGAGAVVFFGGSNTTPANTFVGFYDGNKSLYNPNSNDPSMQYPVAIAADTNGNVFSANSNNSSASVYQVGTGLVSGPLGSSYEETYNPMGIAVDLTHGFWLSDGDYTVSHYNSSGTLLGHVVCCNESYGIATDSSGNLWIANYGNSTFSEVTSANGIPLNQVSGGGITYPAGVAVDAGQNVWFANYRGATISEIAGNASTVLTGTSTPLAAGTAISPTTGTYGTSGYGLDAALSEPIALVPDSAGNVWVANQGNNDVVMFFGLATPTKMPVLPVPTAP